jgi:hypothetical protein
MPCLFNPGSDLAIPRFFEDLPEAFSAGTMPLIMVEALFQDLENRFPVVEPG